MLTRLSLANFKAYEHAGVELRNLNVFIGPNNSGKSSILAAIRLLAQTTQSTDPEVKMLLDGALGDFGTFKDVVFGNHRGRPLSISVHVVNERDQTASVGLHLTYKYRTVRRELILQHVELVDGHDSLVEMTFARGSDRLSVDSIMGSRVASEDKARATRSIILANFVPRVSLARAGEREGSGDTPLLSRDAIRTINSAAWSIVSALQNVVYLGAMRIPPSRTYLSTGERRRNIGAMGENAVPILLLDSGRSEPELLPAISKWLSLAGMAADVSLQPISDRHLELVVTHPMSRERQNFADVGFGHSQVLPVLVGGLTTRRGGTFVVEQPEIHLHPGAQAELGDFFVELSEAGVQSIIETHSEHLVVRLLSQIAAGRLASTDFGLFFVAATSEGKTITPIEVDSLGRFLTKWPEGFFPERAAEAQRLAVARARAGSRESTQ